MQTLVGTWLVCGTNFPMWLKGDKTHPTFTYSPVKQKGGNPMLLDEVSYLKKGKRKTLTGYDYPDDQDSTAFVWRGKGLLSVLRSHWRVALLDPQQQWAVIIFSKTLFTPEGVDIVGRQPLSPGTIDHIKELMKRDPVLKPHVATLQTLRL